MRLVFLGTPEFAIPSLKALLESPAEFQVSGVITQPDRAAGRGQKLVAPPVKVLAETAAIPVYQADRLRGNPEAREFLENCRPDLNVVVAFGQILTSDFFDYPRLGTLNVHASLLPKYRGAAPVIHTLLQGERMTGVTIMRIDEGMDTGGLLRQASLPVDEDVTAGELEAVLARRGAELLLEVIPLYARGEIVPEPQRDEEASYAPLVEKADARIDWAARAAIIHNRIRAFNPRPGAFAFFREEMVKIWRSQKVFERPRSECTEEAPGTVLTAAAAELLVRCGEGTALRLLELQLPNRRRMNARDFANGVQLRTGEVLG